MTFVASTLQGHRGKGGGGIGPEETLIARKGPCVGKAWEQACGICSSDVASPLSHGSNPNSNMAGRRREDDQNLVAFVSENQRGEVLETPIARQGGGKPGQGYPAVREGASVRRLTPTECERLQDIPDGWTNPTGDAPDSRRYAGLGDAVTSSVGEWIGRRIRVVEDAA